MQYIVYMPTFEELDKERIGQLYLAVTNTIPPRKTFLRYLGGHFFIYFAITGSEIPIIYPDDVHSENETIDFYPIFLPEDCVKRIQDYGTQY